MLSIRFATLQDAGLLASLIRGLAEYDRLSDEVIVTEEDLVRDGFGPKPKFRAFIAEWDGQPAGYTVFFEIYSTFQGRAGLFVDDLFVLPQFRKNGIGEALLARVAKTALDENYYWLRWEVLGWNTAAIDFFQRVGAFFLEDWKSGLLIGDALESLAKECR